MNEPERLATGVFRRAPVLFGRRVVPEVRRNRTAALGFLALVAFLTFLACGKSPAEKAAERRARAEEFSQAGKYREAAIEYQAALQESPRDPGALYGLAHSLDALGLLGEYRKTLMRVVEAEPNHPRACLELGVFFWAASDYDKALDYARRALQAAPELIEARKLEARSLSGLGQVEEARMVWEAVLKASHASDQTFFDAAESEAWSGDRVRAREIVERGLRRFPTSTRLLLVRANFSMDDGDLDAAKSDLQAALQADSENADVQAGWAKYLIRRGDIEAALQSLITAQARLAKDKEKSAQLALHRAGIFIRLGELDKAKQVIETERERNPKNPELAAALADVLITLGKTDEALGLLTVVSKLDPMGRKASLLAARLYLADGRPHRAVRVLERLIALGELGVDIHHLYGNALAQTKRWAKARLEYLLVLRRVPEHHLARIDYAGLLLVLEDYEGSLAQLEKVPAQLRESPQVQFLQAQIALGRDDTCAAAAILSRLRKRVPENATVLKLTGDVERAGGRWEKAMQLYEKARELSPTSLDPLFAQATLMKERGEKFHVIVDFLDDYQSEHGEKPIVLNFKASLYISDDNLSMAMKTIQRSLLLDPSNWMTRYMGAQILISTGQYSKAKVELEEAIKLDPFRPAPYNLLAEIYLQQKNLVTAEDTYRSLLNRNPGEPVTANNLAMLYLEQDRLDEGLKYARIAKAGAPKNAYVLDTLGWALELSGRSAEAGPFLEEAAAGLPDNPEVLLHWGSNLLSLQREEEAQETLLKVVKLAPKSQFAGRAAELLQAGIQ